MAQVNYEDNGLVYITKITGTNVATLDLDNCFSADYSQYKLVIDVEGTSGTYAYMRLRTGGSTNSGAIYNRQYGGSSSTTILGGRNTSQTSWLGILEQNVGTRVCTNFEILNPYQSTYTTASSLEASYSNTSPILLAFAFGTNVTTSFDGFSIYFDTGNVNGTVYVYGYVES